MPKRFTDTELWDKEWFMGLSEFEKLAFYMIKDKCDCVGVWTPNKHLAKAFIGGGLDWDKFIEKCNGNLLKLDNGKIWVVDFCYFQYGNFINRQGKMYDGYRERLKKHGLWQRVCKDFGNTLVSVQEQVKDKVKEKDKEMVAEDVYLKKEEYLKLVELIGKQNAINCITKLSDYKGSTGKKYKSDYMAIRNWVIKEVTGHDTSYWERKKKVEPVKNKVYEEPKEKLTKEQLKKLTDPIGRLP